MGTMIELTASDGHRLSAYEARHEAPKGAVVVVQEIFGVNRHIRNVTDRFAAAGYAAIAPALFDRKERGFECGYSEGEIADARRFLVDMDWDAMLRDTEAAVDRLALEELPVAVVGFCVGGSVAFLAAARLSGLSAAVCYYGGQIARSASEKPRCPTLMHFGERDHGIPLDSVDAIRAERRECEIFIYPAGHGFNCDERASFDAASAALAWRRTLDFLEGAIRPGGTGIQE